MQYIVTALSVGNGGKKIFRSGQLVTEKDFVSKEKFEWAKKGNYIKPYNATSDINVDSIVLPGVEKVLETKAPEDTNNETVDNATSDINVDASNKKKPKK